MKVKRYKRVQKYLQFYKTKFAFRPPFQVLIDATFCQFCLKNKVNIQDQLGKYLAHEVKHMTTVCVVEETQRLSQSLYGAMLVVKQFPIRRCGHEKAPIDANECLRQLICGDNNADHYMLATQDLQLARAIRRSPAVCPLIYMKGNAMVMQKPMDSVREAVQKREQESNAELPAHELEVLKKLKKMHDLDDDSDTDKKPKRRRKGPKGPNPLSCKKKRTVTKAPVGSGGASGSGSGSAGPSKEREGKKRRRNRGGKHIRQMFDKITATVSTADH